MKKILLSLTLSIVLIFGASFALADSPQAPSQSESIGGSKGFQAGMGGQVNALLSTSGIDNTVSVDNIVASIINIALSILAILFLVLIIFSGYQWMTAGGNEDQIKKAQARIKNAIIGLVIVVMAYAITAFVFKSLPGGGGASDKNSSATSPKVDP